MSDEDVRGLLDSLDLPADLPAVFAGEFPTGQFGRQLAEAVLRTLNSALEGQGWDQSNTLWAVGSPATAAAALGEQGLTVEEVLAAHSPSDDLDPRSVDQFATAFPLMCVATLGGDPMDYLPQIDLPDGVVAVVHAFEIWATNRTDVRASKDPDRVERRLLHFVARGGQTYMLATTRGHEPEFLDGGPGGFIAAYTARLVGLDLINSRFTVPAYFGHLVWTAVSSALEHHAGFVNELAQAEGSGRDMRALLAVSTAIAGTHQLVMQATGNGARLSPQQRQTLRPIEENVTATVARIARGDGRDILQTLRDVAQRLTFTELAGQSTFTLWPPQVTGDLVRFAGDTLTGALLTHRALPPTQHFRASVTNASAGAAELIAAVLGDLGWDEGTEVDDGVPFSAR